MLNAVHLSWLGRAKTEPGIFTPPEADKYDYARGLHEGLPFSKGGTSLTAANIMILCIEPEAHQPPDEKCNLKKSNKILTVPPIFFS